MSVTASAMNTEIAPERIVAKDDRFWIGVIHTVLDHVTKGVPPAHILENIDDYINRKPGVEVPVREEDAPARAVFTAIGSGDNEQIRMMLSQQVYRRSIVNEILRLTMVLHRCVYQELRRFMLVEKNAQAVMPPLTSDRSTHEAAVKFKQQIVAKVAARHAGEHFVTDMITDLKDVFHSDWRQTQPSWLLMYLVNELMADSKPIEKERKAQLESLADNADNPLICDKRPFSMWLNLLRQLHAESPPYLTADEQVYIPSQAIRNYVILRLLKVSVPDDAFDDTPTDYDPKMRVWRARTV